MKRILFSCAPLLFVSAVSAFACSPGPVTPSTPSPTAVSASGPLPRTPPDESRFPDDAAIGKAGQEYLDLVVEDWPESATYLGIHRSDARLDPRATADFDAAVDREDAMAKALRERFKSPRASAAAITDLAMLIGALETDVHTQRLQRPLQRDPTLYTSPLDVTFLMTARDYAPAADRAHAVLARLEKVPQIVESARANLLNPPRVWTEMGIERATTAKTFLESQRAFLVGALPNEVAHVDAALKTAEVAYDDYRKVLQKEVLPRSNGRFTAGRELFELRLKNDLFVDESPEELLAMGKKLFAETSAQMTEVAKRIDAKAKGWPEVTARLKKNHPSADGLLEAYRTEVKRARTFIVDKELVDLPPGDDLEVMDTPPFLRSTVGAAYDAPKPFDPGTKGFFFVTPVERTLPKSTQEDMLGESDFSDLPATVGHEAYPGHHLQLSFARRNPSLVRKAIYHAILSEGWALYCEELLAEQGFYTDEQRLMQLQWTLVRAARVVIDVGLHVGTMTFEEAVRMLTDEVHLGRPQALTEVKRYTLTPTQPLSYLAGRQQLLKMREQYKQREGSKFTLKRFHAEVLTRGTIPPSLMAKEIFGATDAPR